MSAGTGSARHTGHDQSTVTGAHRAAAQPGVVRYRRDNAMAAFILAFFASCWFGWAQESPPASWRLLLILGALVSLVVAAVGAVSAWRTWRGDSALKAPGALRRYLLILGAEFGVAAVGSIVLAGAGHPDYLAPWIGLVVGVHFWPMATVLKNRSLVSLGVLLSAVAVATVLIAGPAALTPSAITGVGAGAALLGFAGRELLRFARSRPGAVSPDEAARRQ